MKIYVDEKDIGKTVTYKEENGKRQYLYIHDNEGFIFKELSEHDKQVKKEVCDEIREEFEPINSNHIDENLYPPTEDAILIGKGFKACKERLFKKLDQIQGDKNG